MTEYDLWDGAPADETNALETMLAKFHTSDQVAKILPPKPLVKGILFRNTLARMSGKPGDGKSFTALDMACAVATGMDWQGHQVQQGRAIYLAAEGLSGLSLRLRAWERHHGRTANELLVYPEAIQVAGDDWALFAECCRQLDAALIVVDTQARVTVGVEENSATAMGEVVARLERLRRSTGATVLLIHHLTHNGDHARGSSTVNGAMDTELMVSMDKHSRVVTMKTVKQKDAEEAGPAQMTLTGVPLGMDDEGNPIGSAVLIEATGRERTERDELMDGLTDSCLTVLEALELYSPNLGATKGELRGWAEAKGVSKTRAYAAINNLTQDGHLVQQGQRFFLSDDQMRARKVLRL